MPPSGPAGQAAGGPRPGEDQSSDFKRGSTVAQLQRQRVAAEGLRLEGNALFAKGKWNAAVQVGSVW